MKLIDADEIKKDFAEILYHNYADDYARGFKAALVAILEYKTIASPTNDPLTLEQLQEMDGDPVWTVTIGLEGSGRWVLCSCETITACSLHKVLRCVTSTGEATDYEFETYGKIWIAYRRRLEDSPVSQRSMK